MPTFIATTQEDSTPTQQRQLTSGLQAIASELLGSTPTDGDVVWKTIPRGFGFTAGVPSQSTVLLCIVPDDIDYSIRVGLMQRINEMWVGLTHIDPNKLAIFTHSSLL